ncbi:MAG TPA: hypothetical protein V6C84_28915 [Coleofasciculaceae cyanobacterium]
MPTDYCKVERSYKFCVIRYRRASPVVQLKALTQNNKLKAIGHS